MIVPLDRFLRFDELTSLLHELAADYPDLVQVSEIGRSYEGRPLWLCTVTSRATGPHHEKPAIWVDANIHAIELTGSTAVLHLLHRLLVEHGTDSEIGHALDTRTFYLVPRVSPDGAEHALAPSPYHVRSSVRPWPDVEQQAGLVESDIDGDGRILWMRIPDDNGVWKVCDVERRLLVPREPTEEGAGQYYRLLPEGLVHGWDGLVVGEAPYLAAIDLNRNYPGGWRPAADQPGAGPYPTSEPEVRSVVQAMVERPNICAVIQYHTQSGVHLRPYADRTDDALPYFDLRVFEEIGAKATELTGYPVRSHFHDFRFDPERTNSGVSHDWAYDHLGVHAWITEFWNMPAAAGVRRGWSLWQEQHSLDDDRRILAWVDEHLPGQGFVDWYPWEHPQLGRVEIGGWNTTAFMINPPRSMLGAEVRPHADWAVWHALISPRLVIRRIAVRPIDDHTWAVRAVVDNVGFLPTHVTQRALERRLVRGVEAEIHLPDTAVVLAGGHRQELGQLAGRVLTYSMLGSSGGNRDRIGDRAVADWVLRASAGTSVELTVRHQRAGVDRGTVVLE